MISCMKGKKHMCINKGMNGLNEGTAQRNKYSIQDEDGTGDGGLFSSWSVIKSYSSLGGKREVL